MFRLIQHYAQAIALRAGLVCELQRANRAGKGVPKHILRRVLRSPHGCDDKVLLLRLLDPAAENLLIDVGGNTGYWCASFLEFFPRSRVVAFEPMRREFEAYRQRFAGRENVTVHNVGLSDDAGKAQLHVSQCSAHSSLHRYVVSQPGLQSNVQQTEQVNLATLDSHALGGLPAARKFLKVDVQGHEMSVLRGAAQTLRNIDVVLVECSLLPEYAGVPPSFAEVAAFLREFDLHPAMFRNHGRTLGPHAWEQDVIFCSQSLLTNMWGW
jgi:FkbM family methyltransferase